MGYSPKGRKVCFSIVKYSPYHSYGLYFAKNIDLKTKKLVRKECASCVHPTHTYSSYTTLNIRTLWMEPSLSPRIWTYVSEPKVLLMSTTIWKTISKAIYMRCLNENTQKLPEKKIYLKSYSCLMAEWMVVWGWTFGRWMPVEILARGSIARFVLCCALVGVAFFLGLGCEEWVRICFVCWMSVASFVCESIGVVCLLDHGVCVCVCVWNPLKRPRSLWSPLGVIWWCGKRKREKTFGLA